ncbi:MAG: GAF domain-containing protein [Anaerolineales bacterium]|nr:GAF domain-containing protein [Anaerolineales bacterium]
MSGSSRLRYRRRRTKSQASLGTRMTFLILPLILIPFIIIGAAAYFRARDILKQQASGQMSSALQAQVESLNDWVFHRHSQLYVASAREDLNDDVAILLTAPNIEANASARESLEELRFRKDEELFSEYLIVDVNENGEVGKVLVSTNPEWEGLELSSIPGLSVDQIATSPYYDIPEITPESLVFFTTAPMRAQEGGTPDALLIGVNSDLRVGALLDAMQVYWEQRGIYRIERGNTFLIMTPDVLVNLPRYSMIPQAQPGMQHPVFNTDPTEEVSTLEYEGLDGEQVLGAYQWIPGWDMAVVVELPQDQAFAGLNTLAPFTLGLIVITTLLVIILVPLLTRRSLRPLGSLTTFAERVAAGNLRHRVSISSKDEVGRLAHSLNHMAGELSQLYRSLELRVLQRTKEIRLAADVARDAAAVRDVDLLLGEAVRLMSERFGHYHVAVFLLDSDREVAILRAASSEGGKRMLERGHRLPIGTTGVIGYVTETGEPRIALDVGKDAVHFINPDLPDTRSELALPLTVSGDIIGVLDVQSTQENAFSETDVLILQIIADQLAIAVENARLLDRQTMLAEQRNKVIEQFNRFSQVTDYEELLNVIPEALRNSFDLNRVTLGLVEGDIVVVRSVSHAEDAVLPAPVDSSPIGEGVLGRTVVLKSPQQVTHQPLHELETQDPRQNVSHTIFAVPLVVRDKVIGTLALETGARGDLTKDEIEAIELIAAQAAISLENARLLEEMKQNLEQMDSIYQQQTAAAWLHLLARKGDSDEVSYEFGKGQLRDDLEEDALKTPIELRGEVIGSLNLMGLRMSDWTDDEYEVLEAVADELAIALEQARLMDEINLKVAQLQTAAEIARTASGLIDLEALLRRAVNLIHERFGFYHVSIFLVDEEQKMAVLLEATEDVGLQLKERNHQLPVGSQSVIGRVTDTGEFYVANQTDDDPYYWPNPLLPETRSELGIPLIIGDEVIGALDVHHNQPHAFGEDEIAVLQILADQVAIAVQNARLFEQALQRAEREKSIVEITGHIRSERTIESMLQTALLEMGTALGAKKGQIQIVTTDGDGQKSPPASSGNGREAAESSE